MPTALLVDDYPDTVDILADVFRRAGYSVTTAMSGTEVRALVAAGLRPDFALVDYVLVGVRGDVLARELLEIGVPVCIMTAMHGLESRLPLNVPVLLKPFSLEQLDDVARDLCRCTDCRPLGAP